MGTPAVARIRYWFLLTLSEHPLPAAAYLGALLKTGYGVRALPIFGAVFVGPWAQHLEAFRAAVADDCVNVVCAIPGLAMGRTITDRQFSRAMPTPKGGPAASSAIPAEIVYHPSTALERLHTVGKPNVAITVPPPTGTLSPQETQILSRYDAIITPTQTCAEQLAGLGVRAQAISPERFEELHELVGAILPVPT